MRPSFCRTLTLHLRSALTALAFCFGAAASAEVLHLSPSDAHQLARQALQQGKPELALTVAQTLLQHDPHEAATHFIIARAFQQLRQPQKGRRAARLAFRHAQIKEDKFQSAQLAARLALEDNSPTAAQVWLRRSLLHLPDDRLRPRVEQDYKILRQMSPWRFGVNLSVAPSNNLNNGADSRFSVIDGVPAVGILSGSAQALSGTRASADLSLGYRLSQSTGNSTHLGLRYLAHRVRLSDAARALAPTVENSDLAFNYAELSLAQRQQGRHGQWDYGLALGRSWYGGDPYQRIQRLHLSHHFPVGTSTRLSLTGQLEQIRHDTALPEVRGKIINARLRHQGEKSDLWQFDVTLKREESENSNAARDRVDAQLKWSPAGHRFGQTPWILPHFQLGMARQTYADYTAGFIVPGGRRDRILHAQMEFTMQQLDYAGFVPSVIVQTRRTQSNVSRFDTRETTVSLGVKSRF